MEKLLIIKLIYFIWCLLSNLIINIFSRQDGDVIELCQVSDIRAGGTPKVSNSIYIYIPILC